MNDSLLLEQAVQIAVAAHAGQKDRFGRPCILHPLGVMGQVNSQAEKTVAILHDVIEDTPVTLAQLKAKGFPDEILAALDCVTKREGEQYMDFVARSARDALATRVKLADLEDNMDVRRMPSVTPADMERLNKYLTAYRWLLENGI